MSVDLTSVEVGNTVKFKNGELHRVIAEQFIKANKFIEANELLGQDEPMMMLTLSGWATAIKFTLDGTNDDGYTSDYDIVEIQPTKPKCVLVSVNDMPVAIYRNCKPSRGQLLDAINKFDSPTPPISFSSLSDPKQQNYLVDTNHNGRTNPDPVQLFDQFLEDDNITEMCLGDYIVTMYEFELENGLGVTNDRLQN